MAMIAGADQLFAIGRGASRLDLAKDIGATDIPDAGGVVDF